MVGVSPVPSAFTFQTVADWAEGTRPRLAMRRAPPASPTCIEIRPSCILNTLYRNACRQARLDTGAVATYRHHMLPTLLKIGPITIHSFGFMLALGFLLVA